MNYCGDGNYFCNNATVHFRSGSNANDYIKLVCQNGHWLGNGSDTFYRTCRYIEKYAGWSLDWTDCMNCTRKTSGISFTTEQS